MSKSPTKHTLKVFLYEISPQIWRRFTISGSATFADLHETIQLAMGWENKQQHEFRYGKGKNLTNVIGPNDEDIVVEGKFNDENEISIDEFLKRKKLPLRMLYRYDFLEDWVHELVFEQVKELDEGEEVDAELLEGERACPPEDCGGTWGYMSAQEGDVAWMDDDFNPELFDPTVVSLQIN
ncbi:MAG: plasmid pRiA4b ORF-3 family protein [Akkermansiaceae bacterium]